MPSRTFQTAILASVLLCAVAARAGYQTVFPSGPDVSHAQARLPTEDVALDTRTGRHVFSVEVARTPAEQEIGLMHRPSVPEDGGMLFPYPEAGPRSFWMRNTVVSLDIVFIGSDGRVTGVRERAEPMSDDPIPSPGPAIAVLELKAGEASEVALAPGDQVSRVP